MFAPNRRVERREDILETIKNKGFEIAEVDDFSHFENDDKFLEGTGSMIFDHDHKIAYGSVSLRLYAVSYTHLDVYKRQEAGLTFKNVVKATIFLKNMDDFAVMNDIYASYFDSESYPARETVQVSCLPKNVDIEISMIAHQF